MAYEDDYSDYEVEFSDEEVEDSEALLFDEDARDDEEEDDEEEEEEKTRVNKIKNAPEKITMPIMDSFEKAKVIGIVAETIKKGYPSTIPEYIGKTQDEIRKMIMFDKFPEVEDFYEEDENFKISKLYGEVEDKKYDEISKYLNKLDETLRKLGERPLFLTRDIAELQVFLNKASSVSIIRELPIGITEVWDLKDFKFK